MRLNERMENWKRLLTSLLITVQIHLIYGFRGAVFEHAEQSFKQSPIDSVGDNLDYYRMAAEVAKLDGADIIVYPEYGIIPSEPNRTKLRPFLENIPDPKVQQVNPCQEPFLFATRRILYNLSCIAQDNGIIIVANMGDIQPCIGQSDCPEDGAFHFNTNVVFGRDGQILAKYHKEHLFGEFGMDLAREVQDPTFETDVGRFATFICFDIIYKRMVEVAHWEGVDGIMFPTKWYNYCPFFNAVQYFQGWAMVNNITLLAADDHIPGIGTIGSGIMLEADGAVVYTFNPDGHSKLIVSDVHNGNGTSESKNSMYIITKTGCQSYIDNGDDIGEVCSTDILQQPKDVYKEYRCFQEGTDNYTLTKLDKNEDHIVSCNNGMCCTLQYSAKDLKENFYLGVSNGSFTVRDRYTWLQENCFVTRCEDLDNKPCVTFPTRSETLFYHISLQANFSTNFIYPTVMSTAMRLVPTREWTYQSSTDQQTGSISFDSDSGKEILMVGLSGRPYDRDPPYVR